MNNLEFLKRVSHEELFRELDRRLGKREVAIAFELQRQEIWIVHYKMKGEEDRGILKWDLGKQGYKIVKNEDFNEYQTWKIKRIMDNTAKGKDVNEEFLIFLDNQIRSEELRVGITLDKEASKWKLIIENTKTNQSIKALISMLPERGETKWFKHEQNRE